MPQGIGYDDDIDPKRKEEIKKMIRRRTEQFANLKAKPSSISGRNIFKQGMSMLFSDPANWPGVFGMETTKRRQLENEEEEEFFDETLERQRGESNAKLQNVLRGLMQRNSNI